MNRITFILLPLNKNDHEKGRTISAFDGTNP